MRLSVFMSLFGLMTLSVPAFAIPAQPTTSRSRTTRASRRPARRTASTRRMSSESASPETASAAMFTEDVLEVLRRLPYLPPKRVQGQTLAGALRHLATWNRGRQRAILEEAAGAQPAWWTPEHRVAVIEALRSVGFSRSLSAVPAEGRGESHMALLADVITSVAQRSRHSRTARSAAQDTLLALGSRLSKKSTGDSDAKARGLGRALSGWIVLGKAD